MLTPISGYAGITSWWYIPLNMKGKMNMKAENIQSNASAPLLAGRAFGTFHSEQEQAIVTRLLKDAKGLHTAQDLKDYVTGYKRPDR